MDLFMVFEMMLGSWSRRRSSARTTGTGGTARLAGDCQLACVMGGYVCSQGIMSTSSPRPRRGCCPPDTCGDSTGAFLGPVVHARCYVDICGDSTGAVLGLVVYVRRYADTCAGCRFVTVQKTVEVPQFLFALTMRTRWLTCPLLCTLGVMVQTVQFLDKVVAVPVVVATGAVTRQGR